MTKQSNNRRSKAICSFCGRSGSQADTLIEGPDNVFICPECVELCHNIIKQNRRQGGPKRSRAGETPKPREIKPQRHRRQRRRDRQVQRPAHRPDRLRQDAAGAHAGPQAGGPLRHLRRHHGHRGRLRRRGRGELPAAAAPGGGLRHRGGPARHRLHRRDRQDRQDLAEHLDHPRRFRRGRAAGAAQDAGRHGGEHPAPGRPKAPRAILHPVGHDGDPLTSSWTPRRSSSSAAGPSSAWTTSSRSGSAAR